MRRRTRRAGRAALGTLAAVALGLACQTVPATAAHGGGDGRDPHAGNGWVTSTLRHMTLRQKIGQLFVTYAYGTDANHPSAADAAANRAAYGVDTPAEVVDKYGLGGVIYFTWTHSYAGGPKQTATLSNGLQRASLHRAGKAHIPLIISTDQEQGLVTRFGPPATQFPGNMALGAGRSTDDAYTAAKITGHELRAVGVNTDYAPVSDVNVNPANPVIGVRSFGSDPTMVAKMAAAQVRGYQDSGPADATVSATAKHFPGHGDTATDSHTGLPVITHSRQQWEQLDAPPFKADIAAGIDSIMTAHLVMPALDPSGDPATLSKPILTGLLRNELHFHGVVITDSLGMAGVREKYGDDRVPVLALKAGADMLLMPPDFDLAYNSVLNAVHDGELSEARIDTSVRRILTMKWHRGIVSHPYVDLDRIDQVVGTPQHYAAAQAITDRTVTAVRNEGNLLPLSAADHESVLVTGWGASTSRTLTDRIAARGVPVDRYYTGTPSDAEIAAGVAKARTHDLTVVLTYNATDSAQQQKYVRQLVATGKPVVAVAVRNPYDIAAFPKVPGYLATYSYSTGSMESVARILYGEKSPHGKLPVAIPSATDANTDLYPYGYGLTW